MMKKLGIAAVLAFAAFDASAAIVAVTGGTAAPTATLGTHTMTAFPDDIRAVIANVNDVPSPLGGNVAFSIPMSHREIGSGWATWSHGYTGDVYYTNGATTVTLTLPPSTGAFYLYAEPNAFSDVQITAIGNGGVAQATQTINGNAGASYFGFYVPAGDPDQISQVQITGAGDFAVGEFGIASVVAVPIGPASLLLGAIPVVGLGAATLRRRRQKSL